MATLRKISVLIAVLTSAVAQTSQSTTQQLNCTGKFNVKNELSQINCVGYPSVDIDNGLDDLSDPDIEHFLEQNAIFNAFVAKNSAEKHIISYLNVTSLTSLIPINPKVAVIVHGFKTNDLRQFFAMKDAFFTLNGTSRPDVVIVVDWREYAESAANFFAGYSTAAQNTNGIGRQVAYLLFALKVLRGLQEDNVHLVGHSLGAQVVGTAARKAVLGYRFRTKIARVTGLDPAGPRFNDFNSFLNMDDAKFVDIIHTNAGDLSRG